MTKDSQLLLLLLGGIYGTLTIVMKIFEMINDRRDILLEVKERQKPLSLEAKVLLRNDWILLWIGCLLFLGFTTVFFGSLPSLGGDEDDLRDFLETVCYLCALIAFYGFWAQILGGFYDLRVMQRNIQETRLTENRAGAADEGATSS